MKKKILIIDDDQDILEPLELLLMQEGYEIMTTHKGNEAYKKVETFQPNVILLDILMSGSDGRTICKNLKANEETKHIPIIMMSAHPMAKYDSENSGSDDFIAKPFEASTLFSVIKTNLK